MSNKRISQTIKGPKGIKIELIDEKRAPDNRPVYYITRWGKTCESSEKNPTREHIHRARQLGAGKDGFVLGFLRNANGQYRFYNPQTKKKRKSKTTTEVPKTIKKKKRKKQPPKRTLSK
jgi:hypothetical protein